MDYKAIVKKLWYAAVVAVSGLSMPLFVKAQAPSDGLGDLKNTAGNSIPTAGVTINAQADVIVLIARIIDWALYLSGAIAVIFVIIGGYRYLTAGGNEEAATKGKNSVINAIIGLVIIMLAYVIITVVTNFLTS